MESPYDYIPKPQTEWPSKSVLHDILVRLDDIDRRLDRIERLQSPFHTEQRGT